MPVQSANSPAWTPNRCFGRRWGSRVRLARAAHAQKLTIIAWSLHARDTIIRDANELAARVLARIRSGDIVLMHDGHDREWRAVSWRRRRCRRFCAASMSGACSASPCRNCSAAEEETSTAFTLLSG